MIRPAILWNDGRATRECGELLAAVPDLARIAGVIAMPGLTAPKLLWLKANEPETFGRISKILSAKDYLRLRLTGDAITEMSDAAGTLWLDEAARDWSDTILAATGLSRAEMPSLGEGSAAAGRLLDSVRAESGNRRPRRARGRSRRRVGRRHRHRSGGGRRRRRLARHVGAVPGDRRALPPAAGDAAARLRACAARPLVPHGGDAERRELPGADGAARGRARHRPSARPRRGDLLGPVAAPVPALPCRRAHAA